MLVWLNAFCITQLIEVPLYAWAMGGRRYGPQAFGASLITHPFVWFIFPGILPWLKYWQYLGVAEGFAIGVEGWYLGYCGLKRPWRWSFIANGLSCTAGLVAPYAAGLLRNTLLG